MSDYQLICLIRHGETDWNKERRIQGREDIPLNETGFAQAVSCGEALKTIKWNGKIIVSSPLSRASQTAKEIGKILEIDHIIYRSNLMERDYGSASGTPKTGKGRRIEYPIDQYQGVETWDALSSRIYQCVLHTVCEQKEDLIIVSHGAAISALISYLSNGAVNPANHILTNTSMNILIYENGELRILAHDLESQELSQGIWKDENWINIT